MQATKQMREDNPEFVDPIFLGDHLEEQGEVAGAWVIRHPGKVARKGTAKKVAEAVGYNGRKISLEAKDQGQLVELWGNYWDGGSRSYWFSFREGKAQRFPDGHPIYNRAIPPVEMAPDTILVENIISCGRDLGLRIYGTPETLMKNFS